VTGTGLANPDPEPQGTPSATAGSEMPGSVGGPLVCRVHYDLVDQWTDGFQAAVTVTTGPALDGWEVAWSFRTGQHVGRMWAAEPSQNGSRATATAADHDSSVPAGGTLSFGFLASRHERNSAPYDFTLDGHRCTTV
jgi:cellulase/cellobiase CelA1